MAEDQHDGANGEAPRVRHYDSLSTQPPTSLPNRPNPTKGPGRFVGRLVQFSGYLHGDPGDLLCGEHLQVVDAGTDEHGNAVFRVARRFGGGGKLDWGGASFAYPDEVGVSMKARKVGQGGRPSPDGRGFRSGVHLNPVRRAFRNVLHGVGDD